MNALQEEVLYCIEQSGQVPAINDWTQLWQAIGFRLAGLKFLTEAKTFYVNGSGGSDSNSGLTAGQPFVTLQGAVNTIANSYVALQQVSLLVAPGTYGGVTIRPSLIASWNIVGSPGNPLTTVIDALSLGVNSGRGVQAVNTAVALNGFSIRSYYENIVAIQGGTIDGTNLRFLGNTAGGLVSVSAGLVFLYGPNVIQGGAQYAFATNGGQILLGYQDLAGSNPLTITLVGSPAFSSFLLSANGGQITAIPAAITFSGSCSGSRYLAFGNGVINSNGGGANFFPGSTAGSVSTGGQYL